MFTFVTSCCSPHICTSQQKSSTECLIWCQSGCVRILPFDRLRGFCHSTVSLSSIIVVPSAVNRRKSRSTRDSLRKMADRRRRRRNTSTSDSDRSEDESIPSLNSNARVPQDSECVSSNLSKFLNLNSENYQ